MVEFLKYFQDYWLIIKAIQYKHNKHNSGFFLRYRRLVNTDMKLQYKGLQRDNNNNSNSLSSPAGSAVT